MSELLGKSYLATALRDLEVRDLFTVAGGHFLPTYQELAVTDGAPRVIAARHEQGAGYMASGHALVTGRAGVVFSGAPGPGATNLVTAVANAAADSIPLVVLTGQVDSRYVHQNVLQHCDNVGLFRSITKESLQVEHADEIGPLLQRALAVAEAGRPGPVHLAIPQGLQAAVAAVGRAPVPFRTDAPRPAARSVAALGDLLAGAERPAILAGHGVIRSGGSEALVALAERLGAPVATSRSGVGSIPTTHPLAVGMLGFYGAERAREALAGADVVLVVGCALGEQTTYGWRADLFGGARLAQVDVDASQFGRSYSVEVPVLGDAGATLAELAGVGGESPSGWWATEAPVGDPASGGGSVGQAAGAGVSARTVLGALNELKDDRTIVSADIGNHRLWVCELLEVTRPEGLLQSCEFDAMGFSVPAALGAAFAEPGTRVVAIAGDGGFVHTMGELSLAATHRLPVVSVVFVDASLGILRHQAEEMWGQSHQVALDPIDFVGVAEAMGVPAARAADDDEVGAGLARGLAQEGPFLLEVAIDPAEVFPGLATKIAQRRRDLLGEGNA